MDQLKGKLKALAEKVGEREAKRLNLDKMQRVINKLQSFADGCQECANFLTEMDEHIERIMAAEGPMDKSALQAHKQLLSGMGSHLQKSHQLLPEGHYMSMYMSIGFALGISFGLTLMDNIAIGMSLGLCIGIAIGVAMDEDARKKGKSI